MNKQVYQAEFSKTHPVLFHIQGREQKANKILSVFKDYFGDNLWNLRLLDVGSSTGIMTSLLSNHFKYTVGIDIDRNAVAHAQRQYANNKVDFLLQDSMNIGFPDNTFDAINCSHVYEHVPNSNQLIGEIYRVLKPNGVCFFSAGNRIIFIEGHYKLPLLSVMPKYLGNVYLQLFRKVPVYYETHLTYWGLRRLVAQFTLIDYTARIIKDPVKFYATDLIIPGSIMQKVYVFIIKLFYWLCPTYIWLLKKV
jgi:SAM-dependent methyltransferase